MTTLLGTRVKTKPYAAGPHWPARCGVLGCARSLRLRTRPASLPRTRPVHPIGEASFRNVFSCPYLLLDSLAHRGQLELRPCHLIEQLGRREPLTLRPELPEERAGLRAREPGASELLAEERLDLGVKRPCSQVARA